MELDLSQFGFGDSIEPETMIIVMIAVLGLACLGPLLAMGGRNRENGDDGGHPLRSKLYFAEPERVSPPQPLHGKMKYKTRVNTN